MKHLNELSSTKLKRKALVLAMATFLPITASYAEDDVEDLSKVSVQGDLIEGYKVDRSTTDKNTQRLLDTSKTITVIPKVILEDRSVENLRDALRNVSGISLAAGEGGTPTGDSMSIRGFSARNDIAINGIRDIAGYTRDVFNVEAVEVAKGPGSAVYGRGSTGGSINLQTKTAKLDDFNDASLKLGTEHDIRLQLDSNFLIGEHSAFRVNLLTDDGDVAGRDQVNNSKNAVAFSFNTGIDADTRFSINADIQKQNNLPEYGLPWVPNYNGRSDRAVSEQLLPFEGGTPAVSFDNFYGNLGRDFEDIKAQSFTLKYEKDINATTTLRATGRTGAVKRVSVVTAPRFNYETIDGVRVYGSPEPMVTLSDEKTRDTKDSLTVLQFDILGNYQLENVSHDVVAGVEVSREQFSRWNYLDVVDDNLDSTPVYIDLYNPDANVPFTGKYQRVNQSEEATGDTQALYLFDTITFNPQWLLSMGLRWDDFDTTYYNDLDGPDPSVKIETSDSALSWNLGLIYKPVDNGSIYAGVGTSFSPSAEDLTASTRNGEDQLDPEESVSYELGTKWEFMGGRLATNAAIFRTEKTNARTDVLDSEIDILNGKQRVDGLELSMTGHINDQFLITAAYTYQDSEVINAEGEDAGQEGSELASTPENSFSIWGRYEVNEKLVLGLGAQYIDERYNSSDPLGREKADEYTVFDMMASYQLTDRWGVQLNATNLTDKRYIDQLGGGHFIPGEGRYIGFTTRYKF